MELTLNTLIKLWVGIQTDMELVLGAQIFLPWQLISCFQYEPRREKICLRGFQPGQTQTKLYSHRRCLKAGNFRFRKKGDCTIDVAKTKALISCTVTAQLICAFVFAYA